jgi:hypothetical protein
MTIRDQAIDKAATFRRHLLAAEAALGEGIALAEAEGLPGALDKLARLKDRLDLAHRAAERAAEAIAAAMGDEPVVYSGGDDKPTPTVP